jgi:putative transposase
MDKFMLTREVKLRPTKLQNESINEILFRLVSVYNTSLTKLFISLSKGKLLSEFDLMKEFSFHGKKSGLNQNMIQECAGKAHKAVLRWLKKGLSGKRSGKPRRKSKRNKINSIQFGQASKLSPPKNNRVHVPGIGKIRCSKNPIPEGKIKGGRLLKRASGYYFQFVIEIEHVQDLLKTDKEVGIDPGFSTLLTLSDGTKFENPRELRKAEDRLAQSQRGNNKNLSAKIQERIKRIRSDRNHKISHEIVKSYKDIYVSNDSFKSLQKTFGKSVSEASLSNLFGMISYKSLSSGRKFTRVDSFNTTRTCHICRSLTGPTGMEGLKVRKWKCPCGAEHDRDINAARVVLLLGKGIASVEKISL